MQERALPLSSQRQNVATKRDDGGDDGDEAQGQYQDEKFPPPESENIHGPHNTSTCTSTVNKRTPTASLERPVTIRDDCDRLKDRQRLAFNLTFWGNFMLHFGRKSYSTLKQELEDEAGYSAITLREMDTAFTFSYAVGSIISGHLSDTFPSNSGTVLAVGLYGSGACLFLMNVFIWFELEGYYSTRSIGDFCMVTVYFVFGLFQSTGKPVGTALMGNWFSDKHSIERRGFIFGLWTCHQHMGDIAAALCTAFVLASGYAYWWGFLTSAIANVLWDCLSHRIGSVLSTDAGITIEDDGRKKIIIGAKEVISKESTVLPVPITYVRAFRIPMVAQYTVAFVLFKLTNYVLFLWLPYFLGRNFGPVSANLIAASYSIGMMVGGIIMGVVSDIIGGLRTTVIGAFISFLIVFLGIFSLKSEDLGATSVVIMLGIIGILVGGPYNIITSAVAADLASHPTFKSNNKSLGNIVGLMSVFGSIIASIGLLAIGPLQNNYGWSCVWWYLMGCTALGLILISPKIYQ